MKLDIRDDWTPTAENINALPEPLRRYIHDLSTICDPADTMQENFTLRLENRMLWRECQKLAEQLGLPTTYDDYRFHRLKATEDGQPTHQWLEKRDLTPVTSRA